MIWGNISETTKASNFKILHSIALDSFYIFTKMTSRATSGRLQITYTFAFSVMFGVQFLDNGSTDSENVTVLQTDSKASFPLV